MDPEMKQYIKEQVSYATSSANHATENYVREIALNVKNLSAKIHKITFWNAMTLLTLYAIYDALISPIIEIILW